MPTPKTAKAEGLSATESQAVATPDTTPDTTPEAGPITAAQLDDLGVLPAAPMRKAIVGKDKSNPVVQEKLTAYAKNPKVSKEVRENVEQFVAGMPKARPDVLTPPNNKRKKGQKMSNLASLSRADVEQAFQILHAALEADGEAVTLDVPDGLKALGEKDWRALGIALQALLYEKEANPIH